MTALRAAVVGKCINNQNNQSEVRTALTDNKVTPGLFCSTTYRSRGVKRESQEGTSSESENSGKPAVLSRPAAFLWAATATAECGKPDED